MVELLLLSFYVQTSWNGIGRNTLIYIYMCATFYLSVMGVLGKALLHQRQTLRRGHRYLLTSSFCAVKRT